MSEEIPLEKHWTVQEVATKLHLGYNSVKRLVKSNPRVLKIKRPETLHKRGYCSYRIPQSVVDEIMAELRGRV